MNRFALLIATALLVAPLMADSVYGVSVTSLSVSFDHFGDTLSASGPSVEMNGGGRNYKPYIPVGPDGMIGIQFPAFVTAGPVSVNAQISVPTAFMFITGPAEVCQLLALRFLRPSTS